MSETIKLRIPKLGDFEDVEVIEILVAPGDEVGGAVLLANNVKIVTTIGDRDTVLIGNDIGFVPEIRGGNTIEGVRVANGSEQITLRYELEQLAVILDDRDAVLSLIHI